MSYEKRVKDLIGRLVAMSPEPPPYPEEITMAEPSTSRPRRPILMFAGAAVVVMLLAIPLLLLDGDETPDVIGTTLPVPASSTSTTAETSTTEMPDTTTTAPVELIWEGVVFLIQDPENSFLGDPALVPVWISVGGVSPDEYFTSALAAVDEQGGSLPPTLDNTIPSDVRILDLTTVEIEGEQVWVADMSEEFADGAGGLLADVTMLNQLVYTITYSTTLEQVLFTVDGEPVEAYGTEGIVLTDPIGRDDYIDDISLIFLTQPVVYSDESVDDDPQGGYLVVGRSNVYEAAMAVQVINGSTGETTHEEFLTATSGSGEWGDFAVDIDAELVEPGVSSIRVLWHSPEDGAPSNVITIPILIGEVWELVPLDN